MIKLLYNVSVPMYILRILLLRKSRNKTKRKEALLQSVANI